MRFSKILLLAGAIVAVPPTAIVIAQPAPAAANAEDTRLTAFLDGEFAQEVKLRPTLATRLGIKENQDQARRQQRRRSAPHARMAPRQRGEDEGAVRPRQADARRAGQLRHLGAGAGAGRAQLQVPPLPAAFLFLPLLGARAAAELHDQHPHRVGRSRHARVQCAAARDPEGARHRDRAEQGVRRGGHPRAQVPG